ncbi:hypothetical protein AB0K89_15795 [Streptomyces cinnamoneus]|uniref:hypothetical protein n=1 Tax=Streptomyces cinnamoneus TaxID=53446 RepID=UPI00343543E9
MITRDGEMVESGRRWMAGELTSDEYFSKVRESTAIAPGWELLRSVLCGVLTFLRSRRST